MKHPLRRIGGAMLALILSSGGSAWALPIVDQENDAGVGVGLFTQFNESPVAQTFTVGFTGRLTAVDLFISQLDPVGHLIVSIFGTTSSAPPLPGSATPLARTTVPLVQLPSSSAGGTGPAFVTVQLDVSPNVSAGNQLAIVLSRDRGGSGGASGIVWFGSLDTYEMGAAYTFFEGGPVICIPEVTCPPGPLPSRWVTFSTLGDFGFRTRMTPIPEPGAAALLAMGLLGLALFRRAQPAK